MAPRSKGRNKRIHGTIVSGQTFGQALIPLETKVSHSTQAADLIESGSDIAVLFRECRLDENSNEVKDWYKKLVESWDKFWKRISRESDALTGLDWQTYLMLEEIEINREFWPSPTYNLSFQFQTQGGSYVGTSLGPFAGTRNGKIPVSEWVVILPKTRAEEFLTISVRLMATSWLKSKLTQITQILQFAQKYAPQLPGSGAVLSQSLGIIGDIINLAAALDSDKALINELRSYLLKDVGVTGVPRLYKGTMTIKGVQNDQTYLKLEILKL
jgi:hypothetical protein